MTREFDRAREDAFALPGYLFGLTMSTAGSSTTLTVATGFATSSDNLKLMRLASSLAKTTSAWAAGAGGGLDTGTIANSTWYHWYLIYNPTTDVTDVIFSATATPNSGPTTLPSGYAKWRRIGSMKTNGSGQWTKFIQDGNQFSWDDAPLDVSAANPGTSAVTRTLGSVPSGIRVNALLSVKTVGVSLGDQPGAVLISDLSTSDVAPTITTNVTMDSYNGATSTSAQNGGQFYVMTDTLGRVRSRLQVSTAGTTLYVNIVGWADTRGRDA